MHRKPELRLIGMKGLPGSGKSTLARSLAKRTGWKIIDKDETKDALHGILPDSDAGHRAYTLTLEMAEATLRGGACVIYDSPLPFPALYTALCDIARRTGAGLHLIECRCADETELRRRIEERSGTGISPHRIADWPRFLAYRQKISAGADYRTEVPHFIADTTLPPAALTESILAWLK